MTATAAPPAPTHSEGFTRPPTGRPLPPVILVDGIAHGGKSSLAYRLSASQRVHRTFVFEIGERDADQYQRLGRYEIVVLDGTWTDFIDKLAWATKQPHPPGVPNVIIIDTISRIWEDLKDWASTRARSSRAAREKLANDPDAYIDVSSNYWNDAKERWARMLTLVNRFDGISILIARGDVVQAFEDGQPVYKATTWSIEAEKRTMFNVTANVSIRTAHQPKLMSTKNLDVDVPEGGIPLADTEAMDDLIFNILATTADPATVRAVGAAPGVPSVHAKSQIKAVYMSFDFNETDAVDATKALWKAEVGPGVGEVAVETVERLLTLAREQILNPTPPETTTPPADGEGAPDPAGDAQEAESGAATAPTGESEPPQTPEEAHEVLVTATGAPPAPPEDEPRFPNGRDPVAEAAAFVAAKGGDTDGPAADPESVGDFDYDADDDDEPEPGD